MEKVVQNNPKVSCLLFGKGNLKESYQALIERHLLTEHVHLCGFTDEVSKILPSVDIVVHPAYAEGLGVILLQAGACKRAVVSTPVGGIPEIIEHDETGLMVTPGNIDEIADALITLVNDKQTRETLGNQLYQHVKGHFKLIVKGIVKGEVQKDILKEMIKGVLKGSVKVIFKNWISKEF